MPNRIKDTLLLVGDADSSRSNLRDIFKDSYNLLEAENLAQALLLLEQNAECILLILVDVLAPDKIETKQLMEATLLGGNQKIPVVVFIDTDAAEEHQERAFLMGVSDVILKPYAPVIVQKRIETLVELYWSKWTWNASFRHKMKPFEMPTRSCWTPCRQSSNIETQNRETTFCEFVSLPRFYCRKWRVPVRSMN